MSNIKTLLSIASVGVMAVTNVDGEPQFNANGAPLTITLHSPGTKKFQQAKHNFEKKKSGSVMAALTGKNDQRGWEDEARDLAEFLADVTVSFDNFDYDGRPSGKETFAAAYADIEIGHVTEAANKFLGDRGNFKKVLPTSSPASSGTQPG